MYKLIFNIVLIFIIFNVINCQDNVTTNLNYNITDDNVFNNNSEVVHNLTKEEEEVELFGDSDNFGGEFENVNFTNVASMLDVYNTKFLRENWDEINLKLTKSCKRDVELYVEGLEKKKMWALKMDDATGRYTTGFYWGNNFWTGSATLCTHLNQDNSDRSMTSSYELFPTSLPKEPAEDHSPTPTKKSISYNNDYQPGKIKTENPPFKLAFFMTKLMVNSSANRQLTPTNRLIHMGLCLPFDCTTSDVQNILEMSTDASVMRYITVKTVRSPSHGTFTIWTDTTFLILCGVTALVAILLTAGTSYDIHLYRKHKAMNQTKDPIHTAIAIGCTTYDITNAERKLSQHANLEIASTIPRVSAGKNGIYNGNNNNSDERLATTNNATSGTDSEKLDVFSELILAFSIRTNLATICDRTIGSDTIPTIHGLRSVSMAWVILGHTCIVAFKYSDNMELRKEVEQEFVFQTVINGAFSVDTFFFISGLLVSYLYFKNNAKGNLDKLKNGRNELHAGFLQFLGLIAYRFIRLTAPYLYVLGVLEVVMKWFQSNSVFDPPTMDNVNCPSYWWRNILYINTFFPVEQMCMLWSWYLSDDTQFYVMGALILILAASKFKTAAAISLFFVVSSWGTTAFIAYDNKHIPSSDDPLALFDKIYDKPWTRVGPYIIGMTVGWYLFKTNCKVVMSKLLVAVGWLLSSACLLLIVFGLYNTTLTPITAAAYSALSHSAWALSLAWIVIACSTGYGGFVNTLLSATVLYPLSRVTYCAYLVHPLVIRILVMQSDSPMHLGKFFVVIMFMGQVVSSYILSFIISLAFEAPVVSMLKILSPTRRKRS